jgi:hypothetical protein
VAGAEKINGNSRYVTLPVTVKAKNRIEVRPTGQRGFGYLDIMREIRHAILSGGYPEYLRTVRSAPVENE